MKNPFAKKPKPNWKKTAKERGAVPMSRTRGKGVPGVVQRQKQENRTAQVEKITAIVTPVIHPVKSLKAVAAAKAAWAKETSKNAAQYKLYGACPKCAKPKKPRHRCNLSINFENKEEARAEYERLRKLYGGGR